MSAINDLKEMPSEYQLQYCWARAVEWKILPAFVSQPILPIFYLFYPWKSVLLGVIAVNFIWNVAFCTAMISLPLAAGAMVWTKLKWFSLIGIGLYFAWEHLWLLMLLTVLTPIVAALIGQVSLRRPVGLIQEFFMLQLGHVRTEPRPEVQRYLRKSAGR